MPRRPIVIAALLLLATAGFAPVAAQDATPAAAPTTPEPTAILVSATNAPLRVPAATAWSTWSTTSS